MKKPVNADTSLLKKLIQFTILTMIPVLALGFYIYHLTSSVAVFSLVLYQGLNLIVFLFAFSSVLQIEKATVFKFPYGTGKLENFGAFLLGLISVPASLYTIFFSIKRIILPMPSTSFSATQILLIFIILRAVFLTYYALMVFKKGQSPISKAYFENFRSGLVFFLGAFVAIFIGWLLEKSGKSSLASLIDPLIALIAMIFMLIVSVKQIVSNYGILIDLPLPEDKQLKILHALSLEFESYKGIGNIYTRSSGKLCFIDIELHFDASTPLHHVIATRDALRQHLEKDFRHLSFNLIPLINPV